MKLTGVAIEDFLSVGQASFSLDGRGLVLIQGVNQDNTSATSNGSGKSSLVDAICWALYGETARGVPAASVVRNGAKKAIVRVDFMDDSGTLYRVTRERSKAKTALKFEADGSGGAHAYTDLTLGTEKLTQEAIVKALGSSLDVFRAAVYIGQENMPDLPAMTDRKLKELIEEAAGVGVIEAAYERAREELKAAGVELERATNAQAQAALTLTNRIKDLDDLETRHKAWATAQAVKIKDEEHNCLLAEADKKALIKRGSGISAPRHQLEAGLKQINDLLAGFSGQQAEERRLQAEVTRLEGALTVQTHQSQMVCEALDAAKADIARIKGAEGEPCDTCGQPLSAHALASAVNGAESKASKLASNAAGAAEARDKAAAEAAAARKALAEHRAQMGDPSDLQKKALTLLAALDKIDQHERELAEVERRMTAMQAALDRMKIEANPFDALIADKQVQIKADTLAIDAAKAVVEAKEAEYALADKVAKVFGPAGVRAHILDKVTPFLNERTAAYLATLSDGTLGASWTTLVRDGKGNLKEKFAIEITHPAGEGFAGLSGGEKRKIRLACGMALQDLVASRATKPFRLWIVDEIDQALDEAGLERLMMVLNDKAKEKGTVLVISHQSLSDWITQTWTVTKTGGVSTLAEA